MPYIFTPIITIYDFPLIDIDTAESHSYLKINASPPDCNCLENALSDTEYALRQPNQPVVVRQFRGSSEAVS